MTSPRLEAAAASTRSEAEVRETRRLAAEHARAKFNRMLREESDHRLRTARTGEDY